MALPPLDKVVQRMIEAGEPDENVQTVLDHYQKSGVMLPRESKIGRDGKVLPAGFLNRYYRHFNAARLREAADAYVTLLEEDGYMFLSMAGAGSTAQLGRVLAPMIRENKIHAMSVTGANLEEDLFLLVGAHGYQARPNYHEQTPEQDQQLGDEGHPRVTDVTIPEDEAMKPVTEAVRKVWRDMRFDRRAFPHDVLYEVIRSGTLKAQYQGDEADSWLVAAAEKNLPIWTPGWGDSTLGNVFAGDCMSGTFDPTMIKQDIEAMMALITWYRSVSKTHPMGFCQLGGGIPGDFAICVVPLLIADLKEADTPKWAYFAQFTDADESVGGYSGALPTEKASWMKIGADTPAFSVKGDYTVTFPLLASVVLGW